ncbi:MAG: ABC transporter ATP-binding protein [Lachnospiraceae bacterium]|nr:ABC transporter ATP-binding protein [Lachnospiraceae bacterium]
MGKLLKIENLSKEGILSSVSLEMEEGEMLAVMGPSGSGKSTLLYQAAGMDAPSGGRVWLKETEITGLDEDGKAALRLHRMGFVFQQMNMLANLNILDNILLPAVQANRSRGVRKRAPGKSAGELAQEARALMEKLGLSGLEERRITQVSGGQLQRACICRSMMNSPEILFADEPTGALNQSAAKEVMEELTKLNREGTAILMVTHDSKVAGCCERILYLLDGRIRGELRLGKMMAGADNRNPGKSAAGAGTLNPGGEEFWAEKQREKKVKEWLSRMGW